MKKMPQGEELQNFCSKLGISIHSSGTKSGTDDSILQERCLRFLESQRGARLWIIAVISSIASVASALAAWYAVTKNAPLP